MYRGSEIASHKKEERGEKIRKGKTWREKASKLSFIRRKREIRKGCARGGKLMRGKLRGAEGASLS